MQRRLHATSLLKPCPTAGQRLQSGGKGTGVVVEGIYEVIKMCIGLPAQSGAYTRYESSLLPSLPPRL